MNTTDQVAQIGQVSCVNVRVAASAAFFLGLVLLFGAGFAGPNILHNTTHDTRHAFALPCH
jgi:cobalt transporter subunit CbtB